jgi:hypothetical protein
MRNTKAQSHRSTKIKFTFIITTLAATLYSSLSNSAIIPTAELVEIEPTKQSSFYQKAQESLTLSFSQLTIKKDDNKETVKNMLVSQKNLMDLDSPVTLTKVNLASE